MIILSAELVCKLAFFISKALLSTTYSFIWPSLSPPIPLSGDRGLISYLCVQTYGSIWLPFNKRIEQRKDLLTEPALLTERS